MRSFVWRQHAIFFTTLTVFIIFSVESLLLLHFKYSLFTGTFLQQFTYKLAWERASFLVLALIYDFLLVGGFALLWVKVAKHLDKNTLLSSMIFSVIATSLIGLIITVKYGILSYFSDTVNFAIVKNLGGGDLKEALLYVSDEIALVGLILLLLVVIILKSFKMISRLSIVKLCPTNNRSNRLLSTKYLIALAAGGLVTTYSLSENYKFNYGLSKKISYQLITQGLNKLSDFDGDGFGAFLQPKDLNLFNSEIYPGALDIPGNGIDEDGLLGDMTIEASIADDIGELPINATKHVVLIILESTRFDLLGKKVNGQHVAPNLQKIAAQGTSVEYAYSHTGYTTSSLKAIFNRSFTKVKPQQGLLDVLAKQGYQFSFISGQDESFGEVAQDVAMDSPKHYFFDARTAIDDRVYKSKQAASLMLSEERVVEQFLSRFKQLDFSSPQFIYLNFQAAHFPYSHPNMRKTLIDNMIPRSKINIDNKQWLEDTYWNAVASADWAIGEVMKALKQKGLEQGTSVFIIADHGEALFDHGFLGHGYRVNDIQTRIPLITNDPSLVVNQAIGQTDIAKIILSSAFNSGIKFNDQNNPVFKFVGLLSRPVLISHSLYGGIETTFDFRTNQVFFSDLKRWVALEDALEEQQMKPRITQLINHWEQLRWHNSLVN